MNKLLRQAFSYGIASALALAVDMTVLWVLVHFLSWDWLVAATISYLAGAIVAYWLSVKFVFSEHRLHDRHVEALSFISLGSVGFAVNAGVMGIAVRYLGVHYIMAKCIAAGFTFTCNFFLRRQLLFVRPHSVRET